MTKNYFNYSLNILKDGGVGCGEGGGCMSTA